GVNLAGQSTSRPAHVLLSVPSDAGPMLVHAVAENIRDLMAGKDASHEATWNAVCLADFGDSGVAFVALPQIPPRNVNWAGEGSPHFQFLISGRSWPCLSM